LVVHQPLPQLNPNQELAKASPNNNCQESQGNQKGTKEASKQALPIQDSPTTSRMDLSRLTAKISTTSILRARCQPLLALKAKLESFKQAEARELQSKLNIQAHTCQTANKNQSQESQTTKLLQEMKEKTLVTHPRTTSSMKNHPT
jgi:hypothetical protein